MSQPALDQIRWTVDDLELLPDNGTRYEIIDGELFMTRAPRWSHQKVANNICAALNRFPCCQDFRARSLISFGNWASQEISDLA